MLINFVDATNDANHYTKPPPKGGIGLCVKTVNDKVVRHSLVYLSM